MRPLWISLVILLGASTSQAVSAVNIFERPDQNGYIEILDLDSFKGRVRLLIKTHPYREQFVADREGWRKRLQVYEIGPAGNPRIHQVHASQREFVAALRRGTDEVFWIEYGAEPADDHRFRTWSLDRSSVTTDTVADDPLLANAKPFRLNPTSDGHFFMVTSDPVPGNHKGPLGLQWTKFNSAGTVLAQGALNRPDAVLRSSGTFVEKNGGMGIVLSLLIPSEGVSTLTTDVEVPVRHQILGYTLEANVGSETRLLFSKSDGTFNHLSTAIERELLWTSDMKDVSDPNKAMEYGNRSMEITNAVNDDLETNRSLRRASVGDWLQIKPTTNGYAMLIEQHSIGQLNRSRRGLHFLELGNDGVLLRDVYLQPAVDALGTNVADFETGVGGDVLLLTGAGQETQVARVNGDGSLHSVRTQASKLPLAIAGSGDHTVVLGSLKDEDSLQQLWWTRVSEMGTTIDVPEVQQPQTVSQTAPSAPRPETMPEVEGCACTCEELAAITAFTEQMQNTQDPATMMELSRSPMLQKTMCHMSCVSEYQSCR